MRRESRRQWEVWPNAPFERLSTRGMRVKKQRGPRRGSRWHPVASAKPRLRRWSNTITTGAAAWEVAADGAGNLKRSQSIAEFCAILDEGHGVAGNNNSTAT